MKGDRPLEVVFSSFFFFENTESSSALCWSRETPSANSPRGSGNTHLASMCHARTTKGSQLNLDEVDEILSSFFKTTPATTGRERLLAEEEDDNPATQTAAGDPRDHTDTRDRHRKAMPGPRGGSNASGGVGGGQGAAPPAELPAEEGEDRQTAAAGEAAPARDSSPPGGPSHRPARGNARPRKKIRFTGELGAFLDGEGMWSDVAVMEAERKAEGNILPQQQADRIQQHQEQIHQQDGSRGEEEGGKQEEAQEKQQEGEQEEEESAGVVGGKGAERGETNCEGEGKDNDGWQPAAAAAAAAAAGNSESKSPPCPVVAADPRGSPVSSDPTSTSAGDESPVSLPTPKSGAAPAK